MKNDTTTIRKANMDDLDEVYRMLCRLQDKTHDYGDFSKVYSCNLGNPDCFYYMAESEGRPIGFISLHIQQLLHHTGAAGEVQEFYIDPEHRGKGAGRLLMDKVKEQAASREVKILEVASNRRRTENVKVYESLGFNLTHNKFTR